MADSHLSKPKFREGDVYRFRYSAAARERARTDLYWAFDGQVVVRNGKLCDTYWGFSTGDPRIVSPADGALTFVCNLSEVRDIDEYQTRHYDKADVFNLSYQHGCYHRFVVKKDAQPNAERMLDEIRLRMCKVKKRAEQVVGDAINEGERLSELRTRIESGDLSMKPWW